MMKPPRARGAPDTVTFMTLVWLPEDDWAENLLVPAGLDVEVWRSGQQLPASVGEVAYYVPEYMGPASTLDVMTSMSSLRVVQTLTAGVDDVRSEEHTSELQSLS